LLVRFLSDGFGHLLTDFSSAFDLFAGEFAGPLIGEIAGLTKILGFGRRRLAIAAEIAWQNSLQS
jgi:hypothetical protein